MIAELLQSPIDPLLQCDHKLSADAATICAQQHQVALVGEPAVLTQQAEQLSIEPGLGEDSGLVEPENPKLP